MSFVAGMNKLWMSCVEDDIIVTVQVATKAPSPPWRDDFMALSGLRKPGLGQGHKE